MPPGWRSDADLFTRERALRVEAERVMRDLQARDEHWEAAWRDHPVAKAYRALLREAWSAKGDTPYV